MTGLHISTSHMDGHAWLVFGLVIGPALLLFVFTAIRVRLAPEEPEHEDLHRDSPSGEVRPPHDTHES